MHDAVVIGAGPGGLAAAAMLKSKAGLKDVVVLERAGSVGASWRAHYDRLHLHTVRWLSHLPGYRIPRRCGRWVARDDVVRYLEAYAVHHRLDIRFGVEALRIDRTARAKAAAGTQAGAAAVREPPADAWCIATSAGEMEARCVIVATGHNHTPHIPEWPGRAEFPGELLHASKYRNAAPYEGKKVLVVGAGNTGAEIAVDLVEGGACSVWVAVRTPPHVIRREASACRRSPWAF